MPGFLCSGPLDISLLVGHDMSRAEERPLLARQRLEVLADEDLENAPLGGAGPIRPTSEGHEPSVPHGCRRWECRESDTLIGSSSAGLSRHVAYSGTSPIARQAARAASRPGASASRRRSVVCPSG